MEIRTALDPFRPAAKRPLVLGIGNFDGLHRGHRALLEQVTASARGCRGIPAAMTFPGHPQGVLHPRKRPKLLSTVRHKMALIAETGIEVCFLVPFTREFSKIEARDFVADILVKKLRVRDVVLGFNARFGRGREGDAAMMAGFSREFGFGFRAMPPVEAGGGLVSSSRIREAIRDGRLDEAQECLGRPYSFVVPVVHGDGRGKGLGYPTANLDVGGLEMPPEGVYPVLVRTIEGADGPVGLKAVETFEAGHPGPWLLGALNYGRRPTFKHDDKFCAEVFILDFQGDLYGRAMEAVLYPRIRGEMAFPDAGALKRQIAEDILKIRRFFDSTKNCFTSLVK